MRVKKPRLFGEGMPARKERNRLASKLKKHRKIKSPYGVATSIVKKRSKDRYLKMPKKRGVK